MADVYITKVEAARRQIDAAIRILFSEEDPLVIHTITAAALGILEALDAKRSRPPSNDTYQDVLDQLSQRFPQAKSFDLGAFKKWYRIGRNRPANFLKHADQDADKKLNPKALDTDHLMLEACSLYVGLGHEATPEMQVFGRWHLAVYPHEPGDRIETAAGFVDNLEREAQLQFGAFLVDQIVSITPSTK